MENKKFSTQSIVEVGIMSGLIIVMFMIVNYVPIIGSFFMFVLPLPITILLVKYNIKVSTSAIIVSTMLLAIINNPITAIGNALMFGLTGSAMGYCIKNKKTPIFTIMLETIASIFSILVGYALTIYVVMGTNLIAIINQQINMIRESVDLTKEIYAGMGVSMESVPLFDAINSITPEFLMTVLPGFLVVIALITAYINYMVTKTIMKKLRYEVAELRPFSTWYIDNRIGAMLILVLIISLMMINHGIDMGSYIFGSINVVFQIMMIVLGFSVIIFYLKDKLKLKKGFIIVISIFILFNVTLNKLVFLIGIADLVLDLRRLDPNSLSNSIKNYLDKKNIK